MEDFFESRLGHIIRWIFFFPSSIIAFFLAYAISNIFLYLSGTYMEFGESMFHYAIRNLISNGFGGFAFVYVGTIVAPQFNKIISLFLTVIFSAISLLAIFGGTFLGTFFNNSAFEGWVDILAICASIIGSGYACFLLFEEY